MKGYTTSLFVETKDSDPEDQDHYGLYLEMHNGPFPCKLEFTMEAEHHDGKVTSVKKSGPITRTYDRATVTAWSIPKLISKADVVPDSPYVKDGYVTFKVTFKFL